jgi:hypothetical protein
MTDRQNNGPARPSRATLDPDRRPTPEVVLAGFWLVPPGTPLVACDRCACPVPATAKAQRIHMEHHATVDAGLPR